MPSYVFNTTAGNTYTVNVHMGRNGTTGTILSGTLITFERLSWKFIFVFFYFSIKNKK